MKFSREMLIDLFLMALAALWFALASDVALSYPENVRFKYQSCAACHVSPTGGGATTAYGRMSGEDMATWAPENSGQLLGFIPEPERVAVGGDTRAIQIDTPAYRRAFLMQNDYELGLKLSNEIWVDASYGRYEGHDKPESRRHFVLWQPYELVSVRAGRFLPAYGLNIPDHTAATRGALGFGEDRESVNAEVSLHGSYGELFLTESVANGSSLTLGDDPQYRTHAADPAYFGRLSLFFSKSVILGASVRAASSRRADKGLQYDYTYGPFLSWGITREAYILAEGDRQFRDGVPHADVSYTELGYAVWRGIHVQATHEYLGGNRYGIGLALYPFPHIELLARSKYQDGIWGSQYLLHLNW